MWVTFESLDGINTIGDFTSFVASGSSRWQQSVPGIEDIRINSTADGAEQPAFWLRPTRDVDQPLLVILHSWSAPYTQHAGIPFAMWAQENGWAVIAPNFRGRNDDPDAVGSHLAVQDAADAIDYAVAQPGVDADRVYVVGYSGGGMMALLLAGRHPDKVTAVSAWGPPHDLVKFYDFSRTMGRGYANDIWRACGGDPTVAGPVQDECLTRSPVTYLDSARDHEVPVFISQGIRDPFVPPRVAAEVFNRLADPEDRLSAEEVDLFGRELCPAVFRIGPRPRRTSGTGIPLPSSPGSRLRCCSSISSHATTWSTTRAHGGSHPTLAEHGADFRSRWAARRRHRDGRRVSHRQDRRARRALGGHPVLRPVRVRDHRLALRRGGSDRSPRSRLVLPQAPASPLPGPSGRLSGDGRSGDGVGHASFRRLVCTPTMHASTASIWDA